MGKEVEIVWLISLSFFVLLLGVWVRLVRKCFEWVRIEKFPVKHVYLPNVF